MDGETNTEPKRGPGRPPKSSVPTASVDGVAVLIYTPLDQGDPHMTRWNGVTFKANLPKELPYATHGEMIELAKGNAHFSVDGKQYQRIASDREPVPPAGSDSPPIDPAKEVEVE